MDSELSAGALEEIQRSKNEAEEQLRDLLSALLREYSQAKAVALEDGLTGSNWEHILRAFIAYGQNYFDAEARHIVGARPPEDELQSRLSGLLTRTLALVRSKHLLVDGRVFLSVYPNDDELAQDGARRLEKALQARSESWRGRAEPATGVRAIVAQQRKRRVAEALKSARKLIGQPVPKSVIWRAVGLADRTLLNRYENDATGQTQASTENIERVLSQMESDSPKAIRQILDEADRRRDAARQAK
jgi:hypothetical protein